MAVSKTLPSVTTREEVLGVKLRLARDAFMYVNTGNCQNQGARPYQEDSFGYSDIINSDVVSEKGLFAVLSDGIGGLSDGKEVSSYVVQAAISAFEGIDPRGSIHLMLKSIVEGINKNICENYVQNGVSTAGATVVLAYIFKNRIYWACAGDSRLYLLRNGKMLALNEDHDYKNELFREYLRENIELAAVESNPQRDSLVSFIGKAGQLNIDCSVTGFRIKPGDTFVLCSDGIYNGISDETMAEILSVNDAQEASEAIVRSVLDMRYPGQDNMTVMVIKCSK